MIMQPYRKQFVNPFLKKTVLMNGRFQGEKRNAKSNIKTKNTHKHTKEDFAKFIDLITRKT